MRLLDSRSSNWAIKHFYVIMALVGLAILVTCYPVVGYLAERNRRISQKTSFDDPNFMYIHNGGDVRVVGILSVAILGGLLILPPIVAVGYMLIRRGATFKMLKLKGSNVA